MKKRVAVLISGAGSNLQALIDASSAGDYPAEICLVISNRPNAGGLGRADKAGIANLCIDHKTFPSRASFEEQINSALLEHKIEIICLAGFMRILTKSFVEKWQNQILNIHPSLLPLFKGLHVQQQALDAGVSESGCTVHVVTPDLDDGPIIGQARVPIMPGDDADMLSARIMVEEHKLYPQALKKFAQT